MSMYYSSRDLQRYIWDHRRLRGSEGHDAPWWTGTPRRGTTRGGFEVGKPRTEVSIVCVRSPPSNPTLGYPGSTGNAVGFERRRKIKRSGMRTILISAHGFPPSNQPLVAPRTKGSSSHHHQHEACLRFSAMTWLDVFSRHGSGAKARNVDTNRATPIHIEAY